MNFNESHTQKKTIRGKKTIRKKMEAINKELEILSSLLGFKIQTFRKGLSNEESKRLAHDDITTVSLQKMRNTSNFK